MTDYQNIACTAELAYQSAPLQRDIRNLWQRTGLPIRAGP
jgi:hypothetical protein